MDTSFKIKKFLVVVLLVSIWVNISEVFRYFVIVMPETREYLSMVPNIASMNWSIFLIWGIWDTILTASIVFMYWLVTSTFGNKISSIFIAGGASWLFFFVLFWMGMYNMSLASMNLVAIALPLALLETIVASFIASRLYARSDA